MRWLASAVMVTFVLLGSAWMWRGEIATRVLAHGAASAMQTDRIADLPDGLHVVLCGAGSPLPDRVRSGPCVAVIAGSTMVVVDAGAGSPRNLQRMGLAPGRVAAVFVTHFHSDHIDGLGELAMLRWTGGGWATPLPVHAPPGIDDVVDGFNLAYRADFGYRVAHHGEDVVPASGAGSVAQPFDLPGPYAPTVVWHHSGLTVTAFRVAHDPVEPAVGYRFDYGGRSAVISGDTTRSEEVLAIARGADLLVHEALAPHLVAVLERAAHTSGQARLAKILADIPDYHTSPADAAAIAADAGVRMLVLYHIVPALQVPGLDAAFLRGVRDTYDGPIIVGRDGTRVTLPANSASVTHSTLR
jgi:ribonuclease Z